MAACRLKELNHKEEDNMFYYHSSEVLIPAL